MWKTEAEISAFFLSGISFNLDESPTAQEAVDLATEKCKLCYENKHIQACVKLSKAELSQEVRFLGQTVRVGEA